MTWTPTARPWVSTMPEGGFDAVLELPVGEVGGEVGEFVDDEDDQRFVGGRLVLADLTGEAFGAVLRDPGGLLDEFGHDAEVAGGESGEHGPADAEFHAALRVQAPELDEAGADAAGQAADDGPDDGALAGAGRPDDEDLRAE